MNRRIIAFAVAGGLMLSAGAFQRPTKANCDFRDAFSKAIDWDGTLQFGTSSSYDATLAVPSRDTTRCLPTSCPEGS